ncbi:MAG: U32 family peptidase [Clostridia bacterium]|nr:U32 family peptidase [Clostridia bacterium]
MLEILAPAGNVECAKAAINSGANAIYLGYSAFSARQSAENFNLDSLSEMIKNAHLCGVCVYVAMNTVVKEAETDEFIRTLLTVWNTGADAIILQDALLGKAIKEKYPQIVLHLSTQAGVCTENGARFAKECGFSRVILARETPLSEIEKITKIIETEAFVQGALCTCFSGQCYFSSFAGGNSGNRGRCKQPCRKLYSYDRNGFEEKAYALSLSDLSVGEKIEKYMAAGVVSFKIEGRMRRAEYVAAAVRYYRALLDKASERDKAGALSDLKRAYNRGNYTNGLAFGQDKRFLSTAVQGHIGEKVGVVKVISGSYFVESAFRPRAGDAFKILREGKEIGGATFLKAQGRGFLLSSKTRLKNGDGVFITTDTAVNARVLQAEKCGEISLTLRFHENELAYVSGGGSEIVSEEVLQTAQSRPLTQTELKACFEKTDGLPLRVRFEEIDLKGNIFIAKSQLNALRRAFYEKLTKSVREPYAYEEIKTHLSKSENHKTAVIATDFSGVETDIAIYKANDYNAPLPQNFTQGNFEKYLYYPPFVTSEDEEKFSAWIKENPIDGIYAENYGAIEFAKTHKLKVFAGTGLNLVSGTAILNLPETVQYYALSKELNERELGGLIGENAFALSSGNIKLMDLCYCPFGKTCASCDQKAVYALTDENGRIFPVRRYRAANGNCRFEVYNCADLISVGIKGGGKLLDLTLTQNKRAAIEAKENVEEQKKIYQSHTSGHYKRGVL